jgi:hypothetical protein
MPRDRSESGMPRSAVVLWVGLCLGTGTIGAGCSPATPSSTDVHATPAHLKLMREKGRVSLKTKSTKPSSRPARPKSVSP